MKVLYEEPTKAEGYTRWSEEGVAYDLWYKKTTMIFDPRMEGLPEKLVSFLLKWGEKIKEYKKTYREAYPAKLAKIEFIYEGVFYTLYPAAVGATYETDFMSDKPYTVSWDSLFECYEKEIRDDMKATLGIERSRYFGFLD